MVNFSSYTIPGLIALVLLVLRPLRLSLHLAGRAMAGMLCLAAVNLAAPVTGVSLPVNAATALIAGFLGIPGVVLVFLMEVL